MARTLRGVWPQGTDRRCKGLDAAGGLEPFVSADAGVGALVQFNSLLYTYEQA